MQVTLTVPDQFLLDYKPAQMAQRIQLYAALLMFQFSEISAGAAADLAGMDRLTFAEECARHGIPLVAHPPEELQSELDDLRF